MKKRLQRPFFQRSTPEVAKDLLGCTLVRETDRGRMAGIITETEAYTEEDEASHSFGGRKTPRNEVMFEQAGYLYVYRIYGIHHCINIVSEQKGRGCAVLIRAIDPVEGIEIMRGNRAGRKDSELTNGPGKISQALGITQEHNRTDMTIRKSLMYVLLRTEQKICVTAAPRIGISRAKEKQWRFFHSLNNKKNNFQIDGEKKFYYDGR